MAGVSVATRKKHYVIAIEGLGKAGVDSMSSLPLTDSTGTGLKPSSSIFEDDYLPCIKRGSIKFGSQAISPLRGKPKQGPLSFEIHVNPRLWPEVEDFFFARPRRPVTRVQEAFNIGANDINITVEDASELAVNDIIYIGRRAFRLVTVNTGTGALQIRNATPNPNGGTLPYSSGGEGAEGHFGTYKRALDARDPGAGDTVPWVDDEVWAQNQTLMERRVRLYETDGESVETLVGTYVLDGAPATDEANTTITVKCDDLVSLLQRRKFNRRPAEWRITGRSSSTPPTVNASLVSADETERLYPGDTIKEGAYQVHKSVIVGSVQVFASLLFINANAPPAYRSEALEDNLEGKKVYELLVSDPDAFDDETLHPYYSSDLGTSGAIARNPIDMLRCHLGAISSNLTDDWVIDLPSDQLDDDELVRLRDNVFIDIEAPGVLAGKDGKDVDALEWLHDTFLGWLLASFAVNSEGKLTVRTMLDFGGLETDPIGDDHVLYGRSMGIDPATQLDQLRVEAGIGFDDKPAYIARAANAVNRERRLYTNNQIELKAPPFVHPDAVVELDDPKIQAFGQLMARVQDLFVHPAHMQRVRITGELETQVGLFYNVTARGLRTVFGTGRLSADAQTFFGMLQKREVTDAVSGEQELTFVEMPFRRVDFSLCVEVAAFDGTTGITVVDTAQFIKTSSGDEYEYAPGEVADKDIDQATEDVDDYTTVRAIIVDKRRTPKTDPFTISAAAGTTITAAANVRNVGDTAAYSWTEGDLIELAEVQTDSELDTRYAQAGRDSYTF